ncbi:MAG: hypothetical protein AAB434_10555 [Planctomycetota bacterium]
MRALMSPWCVALAMALSLVPVAVSAEEVAWDLQRLKPHCSGCKADLSWQAGECAKCNAKIDWAPPKFPDSPEGVCRRFLLGVAAHDPNLIAASVTDQAHAEVLARGDAPSAEEMTARVLSSVAATSLRVELATKDRRKCAFKLFGKAITLPLWEANGAWRIEAALLVTHRKDQWKQECQKRLMTLAKAWTGYKSRNKKAPKERGKELVLLLAKESGQPAADVLVCSCGCAADGAQTNYEGASEGTDLDKAPDSRLILWDASGNHDRGRFALRADGKVEWMTEESFGQRK